MAKKEKVKELEKDLGSGSRSFDSSGECIIWNEEMSQERHGDDYCKDYHFFVKYRNPEIIFDKIEEIFNQREFTSPLDRKDRLEGHVKGTVNDYKLVTYTTSRAPEKISFGWTKLPVNKDKNLSDDYKKGGNIEKYVTRFIDN